MKRFVLLAVLFGLVALPLLAQVPTGVLSGHVTDGKDSLPGVTVTITSPAMQGSRTAVTSVDGVYIFKFLPPGEYKVKFELQGFQTIDTSVKVNAAQNQALDATMPQAKVAEEVTVTGSYETISSSGTASTTMEKSLINKLPVAKDFNNTVLLTAGVSSTGPNAAIVIAGAPSFQNLFMINGVAVQDNIRGTAFPLYIEDAVQETTTSTSSVSAEYGRFSGGVVNTLTKSGGNEFHLSLRDTLTNDKWTATTPLTTAPRLDQILNQYEATLGGFAIKDRLWFFLAGRDRSTSASGQTYITNETFTRTQTEKRYEGKLTFSLNANHRLIASYFKIDNVQGNYGFGAAWGVGTYDFFDLASVYDRQTPQDLKAVNYTGVLTDNFFVEGQYSERHFTFQNSGSRYTDLERGTWIEDATNFASLAFYNSPIFCAACTNSAEKRDNKEIIGKASWFLSSQNLGSHDIVLGYDQFKDQRGTNNWQSGSGYGLAADDEVRNPDGTLKLDPNGTPYPVFNPQADLTNASSVFYYPIAVISNGNDFKTTSAFINDKWRLNNNWSFNVGVRYDKNDGTNANGQVVAKDSKVSPRISGTYDPKGDGSWQFNASYAKYVAAISNSLGDQTASAGTPASLYFTYAGPAINTDPTKPLLDSHQAIDVVFAWFNGLSSAAKAGLLYYGSIPGLSAIIPGSLASPSADELSAGFSARLGNQGSVRVDYVNRKFHDFYMAQTDTTTGKSIVDPYGNQYDLTWIVNNDNLVKREYNGLTISGSYKLAESISLGGNYTYSTLKGNITQENSGSGPINGADLQYPEYKAFAQYNPVGYLPQDQKHRARVYAVWDLVNTKYHRLSLSAMESYFSGTPYATLGSIAIRAYVTNPGYLSPPSSVSYYFTDRAAYRTDNITRTDLSFNYSFHVPAFGSDLELFFEPRMTNVFNEHGATNVNTSVYTSRNAGKGLVAFNPFTTTPIECPQGASATTCTGLNANYQKAPTFGKPNAPTDFQAARTYVISLGLRF